MVKSRKWFICLFVCFSFVLGINPSSTLASSFITPWLSAGNLPYLLASHGSVSYLGRVYIIDGSAVTWHGHSDVINSLVDPDGTLGQWSYLSKSTPNALLLHTVISKSNFVYVMGGKEEVENLISTSLADVFLGQIGSNGEISSWKQQPSFSKPLSMGGAIVSGNTLYYAGGHFEASTPIINQEIYKASIDPVNGDLSGWSDGGTLPEPLTAFGMLYDGDKVYILGGFNGESSDKVWEGVIGTNGKIGGWAPLPNLPKKMNRMQSVMLGDKIIVAGGHGPLGNGSNGFSDKTYVSVRDSNGVITGWQEDANLPTGICCGAITVASGSAYLTGGLSANGYLDTVYFTKLVEIVPTSTPIPTLTPTPIPSPTPTAIPPNINKFVLVPGMFASWNYDALMNCSDNGVGPWEMNPARTAEVYNPIMKAFRDQGYKVYPFYYDWRKPVSDNAQKLDVFIKGITQSNEKIYLAGHSMGGLVSRAYLEKTSNSPVAKFMTMGSPHQGIPDVYSIWSGGDMDQAPWDMKVAEKIVVTMCKFRDNGGSDREIIQKYIPSLQNLLATYDYLFDKAACLYKPVNLMAAKNNWLPTQFPPPNWGIETQTLSGNNYQTVDVINVKERNNKDIKAGDWEDGVPTNKIKSKFGDGTVPLASSKLPGVNSTVIEQNHGGIMNTKQGINAILTFFTGQKTNVNGLNKYEEPSAALIVIGKTDNLSLTSSEGVVTNGSSGIVEVSNPKKGKFRLKFTPKEVKTNISVVQSTKDGRILWKDYIYDGKSAKQVNINYDDINPQEDAVVR